jgi:hypothetical protein
MGGAPPPTPTLPLKGGGRKNIRRLPPPPLRGRVGVGGAGDGRIESHRSTRGTCARIQPKRRSACGSIFATSNSVTAFAASSQSVRTSSISFVRRSASSSKSTAASIRRKRTTNARIGLRNAVIASSDFGTTMCWAIPTESGRPCRRYCGSTPHPNPPPQGGRGNKLAVTPSPLEGEGWGGGYAVDA